MNTQYPVAVEKLLQYYDKTRVELDKFCAQLPADVVHRLFSLLRENYAKRSALFQNDIRRSLETMKLKIKNFALDVVKKKESKDMARKLDQFDDEIEIGIRIGYCKRGADDNLAWGEVVTANKRLKNCEEFPYSSIVVKPDKEDKEIVLDLDKAYEVYSYDSNDETITEDIAAMVEGRGLRNAIHVDRQPILVAYAKSFADYYEGIITRAADDICVLLNQELDIIFRENVTEIAKPVASKVRALMRQRLEACKAKAMEQVQAIYEHNSVPELVFDSNEHYLNSLLLRMTAADTKMATDEGGYRQIYYNVVAYIKGQRKHISQLADKELVRILFLGCGRELEQALGSMGGYLELVKEPQGREAARQKLTTRKNLLASSINLLKEKL